MRTTKAEHDEEQLMVRIYAEFTEMPGLRLTREQAQRLFGIPLSACAKLLDELVEHRLLTYDMDRTYSRRVDGLRTARAMPRDTPARHSLGRTA